MLGSIPGDYTPELDDKEYVFEGHTYHGRKHYLMQAAYYVHFPGISIDDVLKKFGIPSDELVWGIHELHALMREESEARGE